MKKISIYLLAVFIKIKFRFSLRSVKQIEKVISENYNNVDSQKYYNFSNLKDLWHQTINYNKTKENVIDMVVDWYAEG